MEKEDNMQIKEAVDEIAKEARNEISGEIDIEKVQKIIDKKLREYSFGIKCIKCGKYGFRVEPYLNKLAKKK